MGDHPRLADARGFTVVELVVAIAAGLVVLLGAFTIIDHTFAETQTVTRRDDAAARGRQALDLIVRQLRAQVCLQTNPPTTPIVSGDGKSIVFYAYLGDPTTATTTTQYDSGSGQPYPVKHTLAYTSVGGNPGSITETDAPVTSFSPVTVGAATTRTLVTDVVPPAGGAIFTYYGPSSSGSSAVSSSTMTVPLKSTDVPNVAQVSVGFTVLPSGGKAGDPQATTLQGQAFWRAIDPDHAGDQPCASS